jgi:hypothetical protein
MAYSLINLWRNRKGLQKEDIEKGKISSEKEKDGGKVEGRQRKAERDSGRKGKDR